MKDQSRRDFLKAGGVLVAAATTNCLLASEPKLKCALKYGMVGIQGSMLDKFKAVKEIGFDGIELDSPNSYETKDVLDAQKTAGLPVHGLVDSVHWKDTLSDPNPEVQARGVAALKEAITDAKDYGCTTVLLVPGKVGGEVTYEQCWTRSIANIRKVLPHAEKNGIKIAIENVWNDFLTDPKEFVRYLDEINSPLVGAYFDVGNTVRFSPPEQWIPLLGKRIIKLDIKEYRHKGGFTHELGDGDVDWEAVRKELSKIGYSGWCTAEMRGGDAAHLTDMLKRMHRVLGIA